MPTPRATAFSLVAVLFATAALASQPGQGRAAVVSWPPSSSLLVAEVVTGGVSASDEYIELANVAAASTDLAGCELDYVTASGSSSTRKASWNASVPVPPGQHVLIVNAAGGFAALGDATYAGGLAADGGTIVLKCAGLVVDAVGWGTAANAYVEGTAMAPPPPRQSIERRPGGPEGNWQDGNDNAADFIVQVAPVPRSLGGPGPTPAPSATSSLPASGSDQPSTPPSPEPTVAPTASPGSTAEPTVAPTASPGSTAEPTGEPTLESSLVPTAEPSGPISTALPTPEPSVPLPTPLPTTYETPTDSASPTAEPTADPTLAATEPPSPTTTPGASETAAPTPTAASTGTPDATTPPTIPTPSPSPVESPAPTAGPTPAPVPIVSIVAARSLANGSQTTIEGTLTTRLGSFDEARGAFIQDETGGIALWLAAATPDSLPAGTVVRVSGVIDDRYAQRTLRVDASGATQVGTAPTPEPVVVLTGGAGEPFEGVRVAVSGAVLETPDQLSDGVGLWLDDGTGKLRVVVTPAAAAVVPGKGSRVLAVGPLGQRASSTADGYRVLVTEPGDLVSLDGPVPTPTPSASRSPSPAASGTSPGATLTPATSASPVPPMSSIDVARHLPLKSKVTVSGVVTASPGMAGTDTLVAIEDETGAIFVALPAALDEVHIGGRLTATGTLAAPYGQLEVRTLDSLDLGVDLSLPDPPSLAITDVGEPFEARLISVAGRVESVVNEDGRITATISQGERSLRIMAADLTGIGAEDFPKGAEVAVTGVVGQRASASGKPDGYRVWLRGPEDIVVLAPAPAAPTKTSHGSPSPAIVTIAAAIASPGSLVQIDATVTGAAGLVSAGGPTIVVEDATGAIAVLLPEQPPALAVGDAIRIVGTVGHWHSGPRLRAVSVTRLGANGPAIAPVRVSAVGAGVEWRLVRTAGTVGKVVHAGSRWRMELATAGGSITVLVEPAVRISSGNVATGASVEVVGVVARSSSDSSLFQLLPRSPADLLIAKAVTATSSTARNRPAGSSANALHRISVSDLRASIGRAVTLSGVMTDATEGGLVLDDGTGLVRLIGDAAADELSLLEAGDAVEVTGEVVELASGDLAIQVEPGTLVVLAMRADTLAVSVGGRDIASLVPAAALVGPVGGGSPPGVPVVFTVVLAVFALAGAGLVVAARGLARGSRFGRLEGGYSALVAPIAGLLGKRRRLKVPNERAALDAQE